MAKKTQEKQKKKLNPKVQVALAVLGVLVLGFVGNKLVVGPKKAEAKELDAEIATLQQQVQAIAAANAGSANPAAPLKAADLFRLTKAMPDSEDMSGIMLELNRVARETGVEFDSLAYGGAAAQSGFTKVTITLAFRGNFYALSDFLYRLRNLVAVHDGKLDATGRLYTIDQLNFSLNGGPGISEIRADLSVGAYTFGAAGATTAAPTTTSGSTTTPATTAPATTTPATTAPATTTPTPPTTPPAPPGATAAPATPTQ